MKYMPPAILIVLALLYPALFYDVGAGINILIYDCILVLLAAWFYPDMKKNAYSLISASVLLLLGVACAWHANHFTVWINFMLIVILAGSLSWPQTKSLLYTSWRGLFNVVDAISFGKNLTEKKQEQSTASNKREIFSKVKKLGIYLVPMLVIIVFLRIYSNANEVFATIMHQLLNKFEFIWDWIKDFLPKLNFFWLLQFLLGGIIARTVFQKISPKTVISFEQNLSLMATRKFKKPLKNYGLKLLNEYKAGVFLLIALNAIILFLNSIDINYVWLNFKFSGETLREFVHEGTLNLLVSIVLSAVIVLYLFRGNLNFYSKNKMLKLLTTLWIAQNIFLTCSVFVRNLHYINHYNLAYKRIGLLFFCVLIIWVMVYIIIKVNKQRSNYYLITRAFMAGFIVIVFSAMFDWARIITRYNFKHANKAYVHYNFLQTLPDRCLPMLVKNMDQALEIENRQRSIFRDNESSQINNMEEYTVEVKNRIAQFKTKMKSASWKEWTWAEQQAYEELKEINLELPE